MITLDTNVVVRVLVGDDPLQTPRAQRAFVAACRGDGAFLPLIVVAEVSWVLAAGYEWNRAMIHDRLTRLIRTRGIFLEQSELVAHAVERYGEGGPELGDLLILNTARAAGAVPLLTFDRTLAKEADARLVTN